MKSSTQYSQLHRGYISMMAVVGLSTVLLLVMLAAYRYSIQTQEIQRRAQIRIDYNQREQAILRAVLNIAPNRGMRAMMKDSAAVVGSNNRSRWRWVFEDAITQASGQTALSSTYASVLGVSSTTKSGNSGDGDQGHVRDVVTPIGSRRFSDFLITSGINGIEDSLGNGFPESLTFTDPAASDDDDKVYITTKKTYSSGELFKAIPYPDIHFGYTGQDQTFVAKRNWWGFTLAMGYTSESQTGINYMSKDYVLSIYEVPSQLGLGVSGTTYLGQYADGTDWANVNIEGSIFASKAETQGSAVFDRISTREGVKLSANSEVGGVKQNTVTGATASREEFEAATASFYPLSTSSDSGLAAFIPIDVGTDSFDDLTNTSDSNRLSPTGWNEYSRPAVRTVMKLRVEDVVSATDQTPTQISFTYKAGGINTTQQFTKGVNWPSTTSTEGLAFPFHVESTESGRKGLAVYIGRMVTYLASVGADPLDINNSLVVNANYTANANIRKPNIPSLSTDTLFFLRDTKDFSMFTEGFSLVTPFRMHIVNDVNLVSSGTDGAGNPTYPALSIFSPEKRFGIKNDAVQILFEGQLNYLGKASTTPTRPMDLQSGVADEVVPENIKANLFTITDPDQLPPITQMNWLVTIEEVRR